jgi:hypothetical protein
VTRGMVSALATTGTENMGHDLRILGCSSHLRGTIGISWRSSVLSSLSHTTLLRLTVTYVVTVKRRNSSVVVVTTLLRRHYDVISRLRRSSVVVVAL